MTYVVCQTGRCQQTYPLEHLGVITKDTKNINCEKCGGILVDENGRANFSKNAAVIPIIKPDEIEESRKRRLSEKREQLESLQREISELEGEE